MRKLRSGDTVTVIAGKSKGKIGHVKSIVNGHFLLISGVNVVKKHVKANPLRGIVGGVVSKEMPIHISNVAIYNTNSKKKDKVVIRRGDDGLNSRYFRSSGDRLNQRG